jgi:hypothetical protein
MIAPGVGLDDEFLRLEEEVDLPALDPVIAPRLGQAMCAAELLERDLELAPRDVAAGLVHAQGAPEPARSGVVGVGAGDRIEDGIVGQLLDLGSVEHVLEAARRELGGHVEDRARRRGDRDAGLEARRRRCERGGAAQRGREPRLPAG